MALQVERLVDVACPPVDGDVVATRREPHRELLGEGFESAVGSGDAARAEDGDAKGALDRQRAAP